MFSATITLDGGSDVFGPLPNFSYRAPFDTMPDYDMVRGWLIDNRIKGRIVSVDVKHIFKGRTVARYSHLAQQIVEV